MNITLTIERKDKKARILSTDGMKKRLSSVTSRLRKKTKPATSSKLVKRAKITARSARQGIGRTIVKVGTVVSG